MKTISTSILLSCFLLTTLAINAQQTGKVDYKSLGLSFTIPNGWLGAEKEGMYIMGSNTLPGLMLMTTNEAKTVAQMKQEAAVGITEQNGTNLQMTGSFESVGANGIGAEFSGTAEFQPANAYVIGLLNPHGQGVTIMVMTLKDKYNGQYKAAALALAKSVQFKKPVYGPIVKEWKEKISGTRLTYMNSYSSIDYSNSDYTSGGGYSDKEEIDLCPQGYFIFNRQSHTHIDVPGATASSGGNGGGSGTWKVIGNAGGQGVLQLSFYDGSIKEYVLTMEDKKTMLNGYRYFRTWTGENAPNCN